MVSWKAPGSILEAPGLGFGGSGKAPGSILEAPGLGFGGSGDDF